MISERLCVEVIFEWRHEGKQVFVSGSFDGWKERKAMTRQGSVWTTTLLLEPGTYHYKFIVDERWCFDIEKPNVVDSFSGTKNNVLSIENWREELISERSKTRDQIEAELVEKYSALYESKLESVKQDFTVQLQESQNRLDMTKEDMNSKVYRLQDTIQSLEIQLKKTKEELDVFQKKVSDKRTTIESEVRTKFEVFINSMHNEIVHLKEELENERNFSLELKRKLEVKNNGNGLGAQSNAGKQGKEIVT